MEKRASKTAYFLNRTIGYLALIGRNVRLPEGGGVWILVADAVRAPWEVADLLAATYPGIEAQNLPFTALLTDFDVEEFERETHVAEQQPAEEPPAAIEEVAAAVAEVATAAVNEVAAAVKGEDDEGEAKTDEPPPAHEPAT